MIRRGVLVFLRVTQPWYAFIEKAYVIGEKLMMWPSNTQRCQKKNPFLGNSLETSTTF